MKLVYNQATLFIPIILRHIKKLFFDIFIILYQPFPSVLGQFYLVGLSGPYRVSVIEKFILGNSLKRDT